MSKYRLEVVLGVQTRYTPVEEHFKTQSYKEKQYCYSESGTRIPDPDSGTGRRDRWTPLVVVTLVVVVVVVVIVSSSIVVVVGVVVVVLLVVTSSG